jgi:steroid delta-isomerase-like uncharacterized protein
MSTQANLETAQRMGEAVNNGRLEEFRSIFSSDVKDHDPAPDQGPGPEGFIKFFAQLRAAFPDLKVAGEYVVTDDDNIALAYTMTGTQNGPFMGVPPTGKKIKIRGMQIAKFNKDAQISERWGSSDQLGILEQIGAYSPAAITASSR